MPHRNASEPQHDAPAMVKSRQEAITHLNHAVDVAAASGMPGDEILTMIADRIKFQQMPLPEVETAGDIAAFLTNATAHDERPVIYDALPPGLIDLPSAARKYGVNLKTATGWLKRGRIPRMGKIRAPGRGGGYNITSEREFAEMAKLPKNVGGRPHKR